MRSSSRRTAAGYVLQGQRASQGLASQEPDPWTLPPPWLSPQSWSSSPAVTLSLSFDALAPLVAISPALILSAAEKSLPVGALTAAFSLSPPPSSLVSLRWVRCCCSSSVHAAAAARRTARLERPGERRFCVGQGPQHPVRQDGLSFPDDCAEVL